MPGEIGPYHPSQPEEVLPDLPADIPDSEGDKPTSNEILPTASSSKDASSVILGCAVFGYGIYSSKDFVQGGEPVQVLRYALRCGINAFDTSPWYHPSEIVMGRCFSVLKDEFPRESYQIITKVGNYGPNVRHHTYDRETTLASVERSLKRLQTTYLDVVYLHDVEYVTSFPFPTLAGNHLLALDTLSDPSLPDTWKLRGPHESQGEGDDNVLEGLATLAELREQGKIRKIGMAAYPLPVLLRLTLLAQSKGIKIDIIQTYAQQTIINPSLSSGFLQEFEKAGVEVTNAAPLAMGILTTSGGPDWHPARNENDGVFEATREAAKLAEERGTRLENVALDFGFRELKMNSGKVVPVVIGCKSIEEIKRTVKGWRAVNVPGERSQEEVEQAKKVEEEITELFKRRKVTGLSWQRPEREHL